MADKKGEGLKTLEDLEGDRPANNEFVEDYEEPDETQAGYIIFKNPVPILRQEAIKWIKAFDETSDKYEDWQNSPNLSGFEYNIDNVDDRDDGFIIRGWIIHFFNISESDLKGGIK